MSGIYLHRLKVEPEWHKDFWEKRERQERERRIALYRYGLTKMSREDLIEIIMSELQS